MTQTQKTCLKRRKCNKVVCKPSGCLVVIESKKYGQRFVKVDKEDIPLLLQYTWGLACGGSYAATDKKRKRIYMHRLITSAADDLVVDHINHNSLDNRKINLRVCTHNVNLINGKRATRGVCYLKDKKRWRAQIQFCGKITFLGSFATKQEALDARKTAELKLIDDSYAPQLKQVTRVKVKDGVAREVREIVMV